MRSVELFAGCGGLALGLAQAGFEHMLVVELDDHAYAALEANKPLVPEMAKWPLIRGDVRDVDYTGITSAIDLVAGGPPCQPFSIGGKHLGPQDERNMWPEAIRAVRMLRPKAFLFENVRGLLRPAWRPYLEYLMLALSWPELEAKSGEEWDSHAERLRQHAGTTKLHSSSYKVVVRPIDTADYGAPQKRHRAIIIGVRADVATDWSFPKATHSVESLAWAQMVNGSYWAKHNLDAAQCRSQVSDKMVGIAERTERMLCPPMEQPWVTVRDALADLPEPTVESEPLTNHRLRLGARAYRKHTGSVLDEPAKAIKAGDHGVPGGENMLALPNGGVRYFTIREMARLQGFPDSYIFAEGWKRPIKQIGNAVPVQVGKALGESVAGILKKSKKYSAAA